MKYQKGMTLFKRNLKSNEIEKIEIEDVYYKLSKVINNTKNHTAESLDSLIENGTLFESFDIAKQQAIKELEEKFNIKLKEI